MIIAIINQAGARGRGLVANNLAVLRTCSGRKVLLADTDPKKPACAWSDQRSTAGVLPTIPARALSGSKVQLELEQLRAQFNDIVIDTISSDTRECRTALTVAQLVIIPVHIDHIDLADQQKLISRLAAARSFNPDLRVMFVIVDGLSDPSQQALAAVRAYVSRVMAATLAATVIHAHDSFVCGMGRCACDAETCAPDVAEEFHALYKEVYAQ